MTCGLQIKTRPMAVVQLVGHSISPSSLDGHATGSLCVRISPVLMRKTAVSADTLRNRKRQERGMLRFSNDLATAV